MFKRLLLGAAAGAAGTTALNAVTYADMAWRARPASSTPEDTVEKLSDAVGVEVPGDGDDRANRLSALGALSGLVSGVGVGAAYGLLDAVGLRPNRAGGALLVAAGAMVGTNGPMFALQVTDPTSWSVADWVTDVVPHLAYGAVVAATYAALVD
ncbi:MAG: hypothetical protein H0X54_04555 [Propionibacteriales bacterium]|jgi:hypothetical protein|nr:hypothetical protein [Propionibacteriales bacterium]